MALISLIPRSTMPSSARWEVAQVPTTANSSVPLAALHLDVKGNRRGAWQLRALINERVGTTNELSGGPAEWRVHTTTTAA